MAKKNFPYNDKKYEKWCQLVRQAVFLSESQAAHVMINRLIDWTANKKIFLK